MSTPSGDDNDNGRTRLIERWFPVAAVDEACGTPAGSGQNEKAIFTWFASRPIAQARAAVLCSLLEEANDEDDLDLRALVETAIRTGGPDTLETLASRIPAVAGKPPVVLDCFSGRGIIPLEAAKLGLRAVGIDNAPVAALASRLLADWAVRDWSAEPDVAFEVAEVSDSESLFPDGVGEPKLLRDLRTFFAEVDRRVTTAVADLYPANPDGTQPWGYLWATTIPCDECRRRFPLVGSLILRQPYGLTEDPGQHFEIITDQSAGTWEIAVGSGVPRTQATMRAPQGRRGKSGWCSFCGHQHSLDAIKSKGFAGQYEDAPLLAAELETAEVQASGRTRVLERKVFRPLRDDERNAALRADITDLPPVGKLTAVPDEVINRGNNNEVQGYAYGAKKWSDLMNRRQAVLFAETARAIRQCHDDVLVGEASPDYAAALAGFASSNVVRRLRRSTKGVTVLPRGKPDGSQQNRTYTTDLFANESIIPYNFDWFETGPGVGPGTWASLTATTLRPLAAHLQAIPPNARPGQFRSGSARRMPYRDASVDAVITDPPYYSMIAYADVSDLFYVWLRRCLSDIVPDLFGQPGDELGLQSKADEIIVKRGGPAVGDHRTVDWYENEMATAFTEMRRVLKPGGALTVVFGHSEPEAWRRLLGALRAAGFMVTSAWPARTESANTGVASIKVTVTIGCRVASESRSSSTAAQVEREISQLVKKRVAKWDAWGLALADQLMASYGPAMQVVGRYRSIQRPDGTEPDLDHFLTIGRRAVIDAHAFKVDELPLDTFDPMTRFAIFWLRAFKRELVAKGEAVFQAQSSQLRIDDLRPHILGETKGGYALTVDAPPPINERSPAIHVARALAVAWGTGATEDAAGVLVKAHRTPDDAHVWATVAELVRQLPTSDKVGVALTACQRNRRAIETAARQGASIPDQDTLPFQNAGEQP